jgi:hypothetical protein
MRLPLTASLKTIRALGARVAAVLLSILALSSLNQTRAQTTVSGRPCDGPFAFVIVDTQTGEVIAGGWTQSDGTLPPGLVLGPNRGCTFIPATGGNRIGEMPFITGPNGSTTTIPRTQVGDSIDRDSDGDGLTDEVERVFQTNPRNPSTFGNGISDMVIATTPPPPGTPPGGPSIPGTPVFGPPGIVNAVQLAGLCVDVCAFNDTVGLACLDRGAAVFNVFGGMTPRLIALVDTPGEARAVALAGALLAVADGPAGLAIIDVSDPTQAQLVRVVPLGSYAQGVATTGGVAYVALRNGQLVVVDLVTGLELQRLNLGIEVYDVFVSGDHLWAVAGNTIRAFSIDSGVGVALGGAPLAGEDFDAINPKKSFNIAPNTLTLAGSLNIAAVGPDSLSFRKRIFVGGGRAFVTCNRGYNDIDVRNPAAMVITGQVPSTGPGSFKHIVFNGSSRGLATVGTNPRADGTHDVYLYNLLNPANTTDLITVLTTPGTAYANVIYNGFDYVADGERGLQVIRYLTTDTKGVAPTIIMESSAAAGNAEEGKRLRITANARDDEQVRNVEFYVDGVRVATDGNFPFEIYVNTPLRSASKTTVTLRGRAFDTGGNSTWSEPLVLNLVEDATPPRLMSTQPVANTISGQSDRVLAFFNEPLRPDTVNANSVKLIGTGPDGIFETADDVSPIPVSLGYQDATRAIAMIFNSNLARGLWQIRITTEIADRTGNNMTTPVKATFMLLDQPDADRDGVPDALEASLQLDPNNPDSKQDGRRDGERDFDNDGLSNAFEIFWGFNPMVARSRNANILDGDLDDDADALINRREQAASTNPTLADTDGDGWNDEAEFTAGSDPLDPKSKPSFLVSSRPSTRIGLAQLDLTGGASPGVFVARPPIKIGLPVINPNDTSQIGVYAARPPVKIGLPVANAEVAGGVYVARPPIKLGITGLAGTELGVTVAKPPLKIKNTP